MKIGDKVYIPSNEISGTVVKQYYPTACEQQTMIRTEDGRFYHAPTRMFSMQEKESAGYCVRCYHRHWCHGKRADWCPNYNES
ncbi:MAG: hypothetical protein RR075_03130, partial [Pygmaiobacter sp.]